MLGSWNKWKPEAMTRNENGSHTTLVTFLGGTALGAFREAAETHPLYVRLGPEGFESLLVSLDEDCQEAGPADCRSVSDATVKKELYLVTSAFL